MASPTRSPGRLPARVYWFRRLLVVGTALALVFAIARMLGAGGGDDTAASRANVVAAVPRTTAAQPTGLPTVRSTATATAKASATPTVQAEPDGPCAPNEVTVRPVEGTAPAGREIPVVLQVSGIRPACTFEVSSRSIVAKISTSTGRIWSTQECPSAVSAGTIVVRSAAPTSIQVAWSGRGSDSSCSRATAWALPGSYEVAAAAFGSEPSTATLKLTVPERPVVIKTVAPKKPKVPKGAPAPGVGR